MAVTLSIQRKAKIMLDVVDAEFPLTQCLLLAKEENIPPTQAIGDAIDTACADLPADATDQQIVDATQRAADDES